MLSASDINSLQKIIQCRLVTGTEELPSYEDVTIIGKIDDLNLVGFFTNQPYTGIQVFKTTGLI